jgi:unsaturated rhamnogalacturonyl hydrolase
MRLRPRTPPQATGGRCGRRTPRVAGAVVVVALLLPGAGASQASWPEPLAVARAFAERYPQAASVSYIPALSWRGALRLAELTGDVTWRARARAGMQPLLEGPPPGEGQSPTLTRLAGYAAAADLGRMEGEGAAMARARAAAGLVIAPDSAPVRFATGWTDDMFMATSLLTAVTGEGVDERRATVAALLTTYAERLQRADGLFVHAEDAPYAWGRGNGFAALGLAEALTHLPADAAERTRILEVFHAQMGAFVRHQAEDGSWRQVVDDPSSYLELSVTAMAVTAMARGVRLGWLDAATYRPVLERGWRAVVARIGPDGSVRDVCTSTGAGPTLAYYLERPTVTGMDDRGGGLVLTAALEMVELARSAR